MVIQDYFYGWELGGGGEKGGGEGEERKREGIESSFVLYVARKKKNLLTKTHALLSDARTVLAELHHTA